MIIVISQLRIVINKRARENSQRRGQHAPRPRKRATRKENTLYEQRAW
jgi:hypothetical protein